MCANCLSAPPRWGSASRSTPTNRVAGCRCPSPTSPWWSAAAAGVCSVDHRQRPAHHAAVGGVVSDGHHPGRRRPTARNPICGSCRPRGTPCASPLPAIRWTWRSWRSARNRRGPGDRFFRRSGLRPAAAVPNQLAPPPSRTRTDTGRILSPYQPIRRIRGCAVFVVLQHDSSVAVRWRSWVWRMSCDTLVTTRPTTGCRTARPGGPTVVTCSCPAPLIRFINRWMDWRIGSAVLVQTKASALSG